MVISSLIVETVPECTQTVADEVSLRAGVEVHGIDIAAGKVVVTIEAASTDESHATASAFAGIAGVRGVSLVYANFEDETLRSSGEGAH